MGVDVATIVTDYGWDEKSRPTLTLMETQQSAVLEVGKDGTFFEIRGESREGLKSQLEGYAEIFAKAAFVLSAQKSDD